jgi:hypothetical protein
MIARRLEAPVLLGWSMLTAALSYGGFHHPLRTVFALIFLAFVPGLAFLRLAKLTEPVMTVLLALPVSLGLDAAVSAILVYAGIPSWDLGLSLLISFTVGVLIADLVKPTIAVGPSLPQVSGLLGDEARQARLIASLLRGASMGDACEAANVSQTTLKRALQRSPDLRRAVAVATQGALESEGGSERP